MIWPLFKWEARGHNRQTAAQEGLPSVDSSTAGGQRSCWTFGDMITEEQVDNYNSSRGSMVASSS